MDVLKRAREWTNSRWERPALRITTHQDSVWVRLNSLLVRDDIGAFRAATDGLPTHEHINVVVDLLDCEYMDSGALGCLVGLHRRLEKHGGALRIQNANADLRLLFELTELDKLFAMVSDRKLLAKRPLIIPHFDAINDELVEYFARHPERLDTDLDWRGFELLLEAVFRNQGFRTQIGSGRADGGVDIRLLTSDACGDLVTLVQAKKYDKSRPIRLEAVQALCAVVDDTKANRGVFITTSRYLPSARQFAARQGQRITLCDGDDVLRWCKELASRRLQ